MQLNEQKTKVWECKIGEVDAKLVPPGGDGPMRQAVEAAYQELTGQEALACFSGWGSEFTPHERNIMLGLPTGFAEIHPDLKRNAAEEMYAFLQLIEPVVESLSQEPTHTKLKYGVDGNYLLQKWREAKEKADGH